MEVFPAFDLPMMRTLNWILGTREGCGGAGDRAGDDGEAGDGGDGAGADGGVCASAGAWSGDRAGGGAGAGDGGRDGTRQQELWFTPIARNCCEKKDWGACVDLTRPSRESGVVIIDKYRRQLTGVRVGACRCISPRSINLTFKNPSAKSGTIRNSEQEVFESVIDTQMIMIWVI